MIKKKVQLFSVLLKHCPKMTRNKMNFLLSQEYFSIFLLLTNLITFKYDRKLEKVKTSNVYLFYSLLMTIVTQLIFIEIAQIFLRHYKSLASDSLVVQMLFSFQTFILELLIFLFSYNGIARRNYQVKFLNKLVEIERDVQSLCQYFCSKNLRSQSLQYFTMVIVYFILLFFLKLFLWSQISINVIFVVLSFMLVTIFFCVYIIYMLMTVKMQKKIIKALNLKLESMLKKPRNLQFQELKKVMVVHNKIYKTLRMFNQAFGLICFAFFVFIVGMETCHIYTGPINTMLNPFNVYEKTTALAFQNVLWIAPQIFLFFKLSVECEKCKREVERVNVIFGHFSNSKNESLKAIVKNFLFS